MKNTIMLAIACTIALTSNAQMRLGTYHADSLQLVTNSENRMFILSDGRISMNGGLVQDAGAQTASVSMAKRLGAGDAATLLLSDNPAQPMRNAQLNILNHSSAHALYAYHNKFTTNPASLADKNIASEGSNFGFYRYAQITKNDYDYFGYYCYNYNVSYDFNNINITSFESGGNSIRSYDSWTDFSAVEYYKNPENSSSGTRYGLKLSYTKNGAAAAWGVYQTATDVKNHFNGATLFGSTTDNTYDKAQVTGGTKTDGFTAGIVTKDNTTLPYTAVNTDHTILVDASLASSTVTVTLPVSGIAVGKVFAIKKIEASTNTVRVQPDGGKDIDGQPFKDLVGGMDGVLVQFDGNNYYILANN